MSDVMWPISAFRHCEECPVRRGPDCISHCICRDERVRKWRMELDGFPPFAIIASSPGEAKYAAFRAAREAGYYTDLIAFTKDVKYFKRMDWRGQP